MANQSFDAVRASEARLRAAQTKLQGFSGTWRIVPQGFQLDMSHKEGHIPRVLTWGELDASNIADLDKLFKAVEDWAFAALEIERPATDEVAS